MKSLAIFILLVTTLSVSAQNESKGSKYTIRVTSPSASESLINNADETTESQINELLDALENQLIAALNESKKFSLVAKSQLGTLEEEQLYAQRLVDEGDQDLASVANMKGNRYVLVCELSEFKSTSDRQILEKYDVVTERTQTRAEAVAQIYETESGRLLSASTSRQELSHTEKYKLSAERPEFNSQTQPGSLAEDLALEIVKKLVDDIFPAKILSVGAGNRYVLINRGHGTGIKLGQQWRIYGSVGELRDPDTGAFLGYDESEIATVEITDVTEAYSRADVTGDTFGIQVGQVLRLIENSNP